MTIVGVVLVSACGAGPGGQTDTATGDTTGAVSETAAATGVQGEWRGVRLDEMEMDRSDPEPERRNPFRFGAARPVTPQLGPGGGDAPGPSVSPVPDVDPSAPPDAAVRGGPGGVPLTFIGFVESPSIEGRVVVLTDGENVFHGRLGDVLDGRYRIVALGLESVDVERIDGRGTQTLRLSSESSSGS